MVGGSRTIMTKGFNFVGASVRNLGMELGVSKEKTQDAGYSIIASRVKESLRFFLQKTFIHFIPMVRILIVPVVVALFYRILGARFIEPTAVIQRVCDLKLNM